MLASIAPWAAMVIIAVVFSGSHVSVNWNEKKLQIGHDSKKNNTEPKYNIIRLSSRALKNEREKREFELKKIQLEQEFKIFEDAMEMNHDYLMHEKTLEYAAKGIKIQNGQTQAEPSSTRPLPSRNILRMDEYGKSSSAK